MYLATKASHSNAGRWEKTPEELSWRLSQKPSILSRNFSAVSTVFMSLSIKWSFCLCEIKLHEDHPKGRKELGKDQKLTIRFFSSYLLPSLRTWARQHNSYRTNFITSPGNVISLSRATCHGDWAWPRSAVQLPNWRAIASESPSGPHFRRCASWQLETGLQAKLDAWCYRLQLVPSFLPHVAANRKSHCSFRLCC